MSRPTLRDVAAKAGLSVTQVSRALNDHDDVAESTKVLARQVAAELRYLPNLDARRLKDPETRNNTIGIVLQSDSLRFNDPFFGDLLTAMVAEAGTAGFQLALSTHLSETPATEPYDLAIRRKQVDGFVLLRTMTGDPRISFLLDADVPFVTFGRPDGLAGFPAVELARECFDPVVAHLAKLGHEVIGCLAEPAHFALGQHRLEAFRDAADRGGLALRDNAFVDAGFHAGSGHEAANALLNRSPRPTAIVAMNDLLALGAIEAATTAGLRVPTDVSIIGFDDIPAARQLRPTLTTVRMAAADVAAGLIGQLVPAIEAGQIDHAEYRVPTALLIRESSGRRPQ